MTDSKSNYNNTTTTTNYTDNSRSNSFSLGFNFAPKLSVGLGGGGEGLFKQNGALPMHFMKPLEYIQRKVINGENKQAKEADKETEPSG